MQRFLGMCNTYENVVTTEHIFPVGQCYSATNVKPIIDDPCAAPDGPHGPVGDVRYVG